MNRRELDSAAAPSAFFDRLAPQWSERHYGRQGDMVARIARFADTLAALLPAHARLLDYGCGSGDIAAALAAGGYQVEGRDASANMIEQARSLHVGSGVRFTAIDPTGTTADAQLGDQAFDAIICSSVLEYLHDLPANLQFLAGALRPGGWLLATVPNTAHPARRGESIHRRLMSSRALRTLIRLTPRSDTYELQWLSRNRFPVRQWVDLFHQAQLRPVWQDCEDHPLTLLIGCKGG
jgi:2-polyprenyl-6-hydroxyphenyl methylase/3-demethylubiquinone-9 3-methyltransferase